MSLAMDAENDSSRSSARGPRRSRPPEPGPGAAGLSPREIEVLQAICNGFSNREIAGSLQLSVETIKTHVRSILQKLNARDRTQAVVIALGLGIIMLPAATDSPDHLRTSLPMQPSSAAGPWLNQPAQFSESFSGSRV